jgi:hypothetical protein
MASVVTNTFKKMLLGGAISLSADTIYCALVTSAINNYTAAQIAGFNSWSSVSACETSGSGYTAGGVVLSNAILSSTDTFAYFDASDASWASSTFTTVGSILYKSNKDLIAYIEFSETQSPNAGTFVIQWQDYGLMKIN